MTDESTISDNMATTLANTRPRSESFDDDFKAAKELFDEPDEIDCENVEINVDNAKS